MSDSATPWTIARQAPLSLGFSRKEYWSGLPCPTPGDLPDPRIEPRSPAIAGRFFTVEASREVPRILEWVAYPFSRGIFLTQEQTGVSALQADSLPAEATS